MRLSGEGKIGIGLGLLGSVGAGAIMIWPEYKLIGWAVFSSSSLGLVALVMHHFELLRAWFPGAPPAPAPDMEITLHDGPIAESITMDAEGNYLLPGMVFLARVQNVSGKTLRNCQLSFGQPPGSRYSTSAPFTLRRGEYKDVAVLRLSDDRDGRGPRALIYVLKAPDWAPRVGGTALMVSPGKWEIQALSEDCDPVSLNVELTMEAESGVPKAWDMIALPKCPPAALPEVQALPHSPA
jgi:hypothetical protein